MYDPGHVPPRPRQSSTVGRVLLRVVFVLLSMLSIGFLSWGALLRIAMLTRKRLDWVLFWCHVAAVVVAIVCVASDPGDIDTGRGNAGMALLLISATAGTAYYLYADLRHYDPVHVQARFAAAPGGAPAVGYRPPSGAAAPGYGPPSSGAAGVGYGPPAGYGYPPSGAAHGLPPTVVPGNAVPGNAVPAGPYGQPGGPAPYGPTRRMPDAPDTASPHAAPAPPPHATPAAPHAAPGGPVPAAASYQQPAPAAAAPSGHGRIDQVRAELDELSDYLRRQGDDGGPGADGTGGTFGTDGVGGVGGTFGTGDARGAGGAGGTGGTGGPDDAVPRGRGDEGAWGAGGGR